MDYVTADTHMYHANIITLMSRPYVDLHDMHSKIAKQWNSVVTERDRVYILGDFFLSVNPDKAISIIRTLNGSFSFIPGNHDAKSLKKMFARHREELLKGGHALEPPIVELKQDGIPITLCHYPLEIWNKKHYGAYHLHGHSHGTATRLRNRIDVGWDVFYSPVKLDPVSLDQTYDKFCATRTMKDYHE